MEAFIDVDLINLASHYHLRHNWSNTDCLQNAIISQMYTSWSEYLVCVECETMKGHIFCCSGINYPFRHASRMRCVLHGECKIDVILHNLGVFSLFVFGLLAKSDNVTRFATIKTRSYELPSLAWRLCLHLTLPQHHYRILTSRIIFFVLWHIVH